MTKRRLWIFRRPVSFRCWWWVEFAGRLKVCPTISGTLPIPCRWRTLLNRWDPFSHEDGASKKLTFTQEFWSASRGFSYCWFWAWSWSAHESIPIENCALLFRKCVYVSIQIEIFSFLLSFQTSFRGWWLGLVSSYGGCILIYAGRVIISNFWLLAGAQPIVFYGANTCNKCSFHVGGIENQWVVIFQ